MRANVRKQKQVILKVEIHFKEDGRVDSYVDDGLGRAITEPTQNKIKVNGSSAWMIRRRKPG